MLSLSGCRYPESRASESDSFALFTEDKDRTPPRLEMHRTYLCIPALRDAE